ncbi:GNAT family N-acetyltransferase [Phenylobacterium sp.]|uniref:GNAT family N-acetyltransferase n=1 Tax=Phenylobacterium sp. TaxID=1871053 RepID=UPI0035B40011
MTQAAYTFDIVSDPDGLQGLKRAWDDLYARHSAPHLSDSFDWAWLSWRVVTSRGRGRPRCVVARRGTRAVAIWPLLARPGQLLRLASPLNSESSEYFPSLLDPAEPADALWAALLQELRDRRLADALRLPHVRRDSPLDRLVRETPGARATLVQPAPLVSAGAFSAPEDYAAWLPADTRANLRRRRRKLDELGHVEFREVDTAPARVEALRWVLARKREWMARRGLSNERLMSKANAEFLAATLSHDWGAGGRRVFALELDGRTVAAEVVSVDGRRVESFTSSFDAAFDRCSPGHLLTLAVIQWALARGLDYDFRPGNEAYKLKWATRVETVTSYLLPLTFRGEHFVRYRLAKRWLSERAPARVRTQLAALAAGGRKAP